MQRSCQKVSYRDRQETSYTDLVQRAGEESRGLTQSSCTDSLNRDLTLGSLTKIFCDLLRHLVQIALHRDLAQQLLQRTCQGNLAHDLLQRSSQRELAESYLLSLPPETTLNEHHAFTTKAALVLLACSHWWFWVLSTFWGKPAHALKTHVKAMGLPWFAYQISEIHDPVAIWPMAGGDGVGVACATPPDREGRQGGERCQPEQVGPVCIGGGVTPQRENMSEKIKDR